MRAMWWQMWEPRQEFALLMILLFHCCIMIRILVTKNNSGHNSVRITKSLHILHVI